MIRKGNNTAFTIIELIVVMTITLILAVTAAPKLFDSGPRRLRQASSQLAAQIKMARNLAIAARRKTWVDFDTANEWYGVYIESPTNPGRANRIWVANPVTGGSQFRVDLNQGDFAGVVINSATFGARTEVEFDRLGTPYDGLDAALASDGTVVLAAGSSTATVRVVAATGMVKEE